MVARTPPFLQRATNTSATCRAASSACPKTARVGPGCAWRCRRVSSTSVAKRRRATSAPLRSCWRSSRRCTPSITARTDYSVSPGACIGTRPRSPRPSKGWVTALRIRITSIRWRSRSRRRCSRASSMPPVPGRSTCAFCQRRASGSRSMKRCPTMTSRT